ncbi:maltose alpha-D-glucosyltransferase/alpha-amylase [Methylobacterium sp. PvP062]|uniref:Maltokinase n=3 Tax=Methylobacterium TaxID=407 RepID=B1M6D3_METRJ|nr:MULTISPECIES: maltose alpha-D-glucosyltransferase [Methylobacterium]MCX7329980.1 maltose alpha-D-glucosyltransferase [Hyphomicrobiales bacterium]GAN51722.1 trehalose synthase [Methylobacterium sp. ME121]ACB23593.1 trehalose synthase [Methylobacterium radiotolerans JCM 2831]MBN6821606.1 maltose alpha-D-glucosyltransferase [Methylobacterium organophilum]MBP2494207.1 maltose alpha-D-glucosyltransferase/alpha-amylase [Methylobacterium sp. PvP105]
MIDRSDPQWYRDAIIYQIHVKSFFDSNNDGIGDFVGLTQRLDYVRDLGVTAIWLMPFYPSPLRDDGYDIADYRDINPSYGTMEDFKAFVEAAHERGLRVITELVINHTSDQHPWFQAAREAPPGSPERNFYVWSDTDEPYKDTRIIFLDTEASNWTWDPVAKQYFWHRFYSHQPDLNFDNPAVLEAVIEVMRYWLDMGVDGLRLDAIPYLIERDGTNCENLAETHEVIKKIRAALDAEYPDRMLLAEANQWPEETAQYFGDGDECHMAFHFPLMPRMYMAIAREDRHPITDIMRQTPEIPEGCQWAIFLRNHDELTLEMVTAEERDYLWSFYAAERRARINLGIRRRLAPLLENDRRKIELMKSLVLSMPGTPVLYYGDEVGMGDNIYLGDRDGVRTPMQWSPDRNGGFSRANPQKLFLPAIQDPIYGFDAINVEAQTQAQTSLLNWTRRMIAIRNNSVALGRGTIQFLYPSNRKVLAWIREHEDERILCVANLSRAPQAVQLDLSELRTAVPIELTGGTEFPPIGDLPYLLTLPSYGFYWFSLSAARSGVVGPQQEPPELFTLVLTGGIETLMSGRERVAFERTVVPPFLTSRRWFGAKGSRIKATKVVDCAALKDVDGSARFLLPRLQVQLASGETQEYFVPVGVEEGREDETLMPFAVARVRRGPRTGLLYGAAGSNDFAACLIDDMRQAREIPTETGRLVFAVTSAFDPDVTVDVADIRRLSGEQSNTSIAIGSKMMLKLLRRLQPGLHPEIEVGRFLTEQAGFSNTPALLGTLEHVAEDGTRTALAVLQKFVMNQGDAWTLMLEGLRRDFETVVLTPESEAATPEEAFQAHRPWADLLGRRTAELHAALAIETDDPAFAAEPFTGDDLAVLARDARHQAERAFRALKGLADRGLDAGKPACAELGRRRGEVEALIGSLTAAPVRGAHKTRIHGDYHLGQVLVAENDLIIVDFEGEPSRPADERRAKSMPLRDVAGLMRSFAYGAETVIREITARFADSEERARDAATAWRGMIEAAFLAGYETAVEGSRAAVTDADSRARLLRLCLLTKALYEVDYEANNRPDWIEIPARGVLTILDTDGHEPGASE